MAICSNGLIGRFFNLMPYLDGFNCRGVLDVYDSILCICLMKNIKGLVKNCRQVGRAIWLVRVL